MADFPTTTATFGLNKLNKTVALASSTLTNSVTAGALSIAVDDPTNVQAWPTANFVIRIENELIFIDSRSSGTLTVNASGRGYDGTTAATHSSGTTVRVVDSSASIQYAYDELKAITDIFTGTTDGDLTIGTATPMFWDSTNKRLGIGTITPTTPLDVSGTVNATSYTGDGSQLTGIAGATGGISNAVNTNIIADNDDNGTGIISFEIGTGGSASKVTIENDGTTHFKDTSGIVLEQTTGDYTLTWDDPAAARAVSIPDPGGTDVFVFEAATQTLTNKTVTGGTLTGTTTYANAGAGADPTLASNDAGQKLTLTGTMVATAFEGDGSTLTGVGDVSKVGTPVDNQIGVWTGDGTIEGNAGLTWDSSTGNLVDSISRSGNAVTAQVSNTSNTASSRAEFTATVAGASAGDAQSVYQISAVQTWAVGVDNSDSDKFKIDPSATLGTSDTFVIDTSGNVGIGTASPDGILHVQVDDLSFTPWAAADDFVLEGATASAAGMTIVAGTNQSPSFEMTNTNLGAESGFQIQLISPSSDATTLFTFGGIQGFRLVPASGVITSNGTTSTTRTDQHLYIPTTAGTPTGVPNGFTGTVALAYDTTNDELYVYNGAWKKGTTFT